MGDDVGKGHGGDRLGTDFELDQGRGGHEFLSSKEDWRW